MIIKVTKECIQAGIRNSCIKCPVAIAMSQSPLINVEARSDFLLWIQDVGKLKCIKYGKMPTPLAVQDFISRFDMGLIVAPFEFEIPDSLLKGASWLSK